MKAGPTLKEHADEVTRVNPARIKDPFCKLSILSPIIRINEGTPSFFIKLIVRVGDVSIVGIVRRSVPVVVEVFVGVVEVFVGAVDGVTGGVYGVGVVTGGNT